MAIKKKVVFNMHWQVTIPAHFRHQAWIVKKSKWTISFTQDKTSSYITIEVPHTEKNRISKVDRLTWIIEKEVADTDYADYLINKHT